MKHGKIWPKLSNVFPTKESLSEFLIQVGKSWNVSKFKCFWSFPRINLNNVVTPSSNNFAPHELVLIVFSEYCKRECSAFPFVNRSSTKILRFFLFRVKMPTKMKQFSMKKWKKSFPSQNLASLMFVGCQMWSHRAVANLIRNISNRNHTTQINIMSKITKVCLTIHHFV